MPQPLKRPLMLLLQKQWHLLHPKHKNLWLPLHRLLRQPLHRLRRWWLNRPMLRRHLPHQRQANLFNFSDLFYRGAPKASASSRLVCSALGLTACKDQPPMCSRVRACMPWIHASLSLRQGM